ncbi:MAG: hypothetical protein B7Z26_00340 [Asticcacaulis sp. 32-58-5]|jgi:hypothetical protein|uniref:hypothetical protein n=1 Tax=Asticcacaulis sp. AND118 TaxID=2840468 RepID=UPI000BD1D29E|nr:hypothetical protein [Asticcacaulis sp. AND118]OYW83532.1 MAG: hypothetical protein B7Z26_00340 [Asticcacaulis sp. 32-58-5]UDF05770.1 hypothetical protein LH365_18310 [Asticcacaulis sp. AND118]
MTDKEKAPWEVARVSLLNLITDIDFQHVLEEGLGEYIGRYKRAATARTIFPEALNYMSLLTGDEAYDRIFDKYKYDQKKKHAINLDDPVNDSLEAVVSSLRESSTTQDVKDYWSKRSAGVAAIYLYCNYLINHQGKKYVLEPEDMHLVRTAQVP